MMSARNEVPLSPSSQRENDESILNAACCFMQPILCGATQCAVRLSR